MTCISTQTQSNSSCKGFKYVKCGKTFGGDSGYFCTLLQLLQVKLQPPHTHKLGDSPSNGGELGLLLHLLSKDLQLLLKRFFVVVRVDVVVVWHYRWQELGTGKAEQLLKHLQISEMVKVTFASKEMFEATSTNANKVIHYWFHIP